MRREEGYCYLLFEGLLQDMQHFYTSENIFMMVILVRKCGGDGFHC